MGSTLLEPVSVQATDSGPNHLDLRGTPLPALPGLDEARIARLARVVRGLAFTAVDAAQSGHPGGSSSKVEAALTMLTSGVLRFDALFPKHPGRDRVVWSSGHCSPLFHALVSLVYECFRREGKQPPPAMREAVTYPEELPAFRRYGGPPGHVESTLALADASTGSSGHGFSSGLGFAALHRSCGLPTRVFVLAGDAETEEGMSYEARNLASTLGLDNLVVALDYNNYGIDGAITEVLPGRYVDHWLASCWYVIEVEGDSIRELGHAFRKAAEAKSSGRPTVILFHAVKGRNYGRLEGTADSHGTPLPRQEYVALMKELGFEVSEAGDSQKDIETVLAALSREDAHYLVERLEAGAAQLPSEASLVATMKQALPHRPLVDYFSIQRPALLPPELVFAEGTNVATRKASEAWFEWAMKHCGFFYIGAGDLAKSILTGKAEKVYGLMNRLNPFGRGIRFGIAEQNMAQMCVAMASDVLPGQFRPMTAFASYGVFSVIMANSIRMALINNDLNPASRAFFILLAAHDGPETGEDGPTHQGLFWMSLYTAYPGIKVYKPLDANEAVEMLFHAAAEGEPVAFSVVRPGVPVFKRGDGVPPAIAALDGAYIFKPYSGNGKRRLALAVCGGQMMANVLAALPRFENDADIKVVAVTSPQLFEELRKSDPHKANEVLSDEERRTVLAFHNGWKGFLYPFLMPSDYDKRAFGIDRFMRSGRPAEIYVAAGYDPAGIQEKIAAALG
jgi:transketolase